MEKQLTNASLREGGMFMLVSILLPKGVQMLSSPVDKYIGLGLIALSVGLILVREYYKPN